MKIEDLKCEYDKLQKEYGAEGLTSIYNGGCEERPDICFVFMNPTGRNNASSKEWQGRKSPWIGTKNIWKLFFTIGLLDLEIYEKIKSKKAQDWDYQFSDLVYENVSKHKYFITNLGKRTQVDARPLPNAVYKQYLELLYKEIAIIRPKIIITFGNQVSSIILGQTIHVSKHRNISVKKEIAGNTYSVYPVYYPIGNGMRNMDLVIDDLTKILNHLYKTKTD